MARRAYTTVAVMLALIFIVSACGAAPQSDSGSSPAVPEPADRDMAEAPADDRDRASREEAGDVGVIDADTAGQKQIKNGEITLGGPSPEETMAEIVDLIEEMGGYVSDSTLQKYQRDQLPRISLTVRIPQENFDNLTTELHRMGVVTHSRTWVNDVTEEHIDLTARLDNLRSEEEALRRILERAEEVEDMLAVRRQLNDVRSQIDSLSGRLRYLDDRIAYSTYSISIQPETLATTAIKATGFDNFGSRVVSSFIRGANWILNAVATALIGIATALPALVVLGILLILVLLIYRRWGSSIF